MSLNLKDELPRRRANPDQPLEEENETIERDQIDREAVASETEQAEPKRPDLDWAEHED